VRKRRGRNVGERYEIRGKIMRKREIGREWGRKAEGKGRQCGDMEAGGDKKTGSLGGYLKAGGGEGGRCVKCE
jgi:hypothetical protein